jgi:hypothetical protein
MLKQVADPICAHLLSQRMSYTVVCKTGNSMAKVILDAIQKPFAR